MLVAFHIYLVIVQKTTYEFLTGKVSARQEKLRQRNAVMSIEGVSGRNGHSSPWGDSVVSSEAMSGDSSPSSGTADNSVNNCNGAAEAALGGTPSLTPFSPPRLERQAPKQEAVTHETTPTCGSASPGLSAVVRAEIKRSVSLFVFGSGIDNVGNPEASPLSVGVA